MADKKISALTAASLPLAGTEVLPIVQSGATVKVATDELTVKNVRSNATTGLLQIAGPGAATTRLMTTPNANFTVARTDSGQTFTSDQSFANAINLTDDTTAKINFATLSSAITNYIQTYSSYSLMLYVDRGVSKPSYLMNYGGTHEWGFAGTSSVELDVTNKNLKINTGNLVIGTAGKGIDFSITTHPAGMTSELLADYEEGTWTPTIIAAGGSGSPTYSTNTGFYTKIGNTVVATAFIAFTKNTLSGGVLQSGGLPFTANSTAIYPQAACYITAGSLITNPLCQIGAGTTESDILKSNVVTGAVGSVSIADLGAGSLELRYTVTYRV